MKKEADAVIRDQQALVSSLLARVRSSRDLGEEHVLFSRLTKLIAGHISAIERVILPALRQAGSRMLSDVLNESLAAVRSPLAAALIQQPGAPTFPDAIELLERVVLRQFLIEREFLLPMLRAAFAPGELELLGSDIELEIANFKDDRNSNPDSEASTVH